MTLQEFFTKHNDKLKPNGERQISGADLNSFLVDLTGVFLPFSGTPSGKNITGSYNVQPDASVEIFRQSNPGHSDYYSNAIYFSPDEGVQISSNGQGEFSYVEITAPAITMYCKGKAVILTDNSFRGSHYLTPSNNLDFVQKQYVDSVSRFIDMFRELDNAQINEIKSLLKL